MTLDTLQAQLSANLQGNVLALSDTLLGVPFLGDLFHSAALPLQQATLTHSADVISIHGVANLFDAQDIVIDISLTQPADSLDIDFAAVFPAQASLGIPGLGLDNVALHFIRTGAGAHAHLTGAITGNTSSGPLGLSVGAPPGAAGVWDIAVHFEGALLAVFAGWAASVLGDILGQALPLGDLTSLPSIDVGIGFDTQAKSLSRFAVGLAAPLWSVGSSFSVRDVQAALEVAYPADSARRAIAAALQGSFAAPGLDLPVTITRTGTTGDWALALALAPAGAPAQLDLAALLGAFGSDLDAALPSELAGIGKLTLAGLSVTFNPSAQPASQVISAFSCLVNSEWDVVPGKLALRDGVARLDVSYPTDAAKRQFGALVGGNWFIGNVPFALQARRDKSASSAAPWVFSGGLTPSVTCSLQTLVDALAPGQFTLPPDVPDLTITGLTFSFTPQTGAFSFAGSSMQAWPLPFGVAGLVAGTTEVNVERAAGTGAGAQAQPGPLKASMHLLGTGPVTIVDGFAISSFDLTFAYDGVGGADWSLTGALAAVILDHDYNFTAIFTRSATETSFTFTEDIKDAGTARPLVDLGDIGSVTGSNLTISIVKGRTPAAGGAATGAVDAVKLDKASAYAWSISAAGKVSLVDAFSFDGSLSLHSRADGVGLAFKPATGGSRFAEVAIPLPGTASTATHLGFDYLDFSRASAAGGSGAAVWTFRAGVGLWFSGLPASLRSYLPSSADADVAGTFEAGAGGGTSRVAFNIDPLLRQQPFALPNLSFAETTIDLSAAKSAIEIGKLSLAWARGQSPALSVEFGLGIPQQLNEIFGTRDGKPVADLFVVYDAADPNSLSRFRLATTAGGEEGPGLEVSVVTSPFKKLVLKPVPGSTGMQGSLDFGDYGKFSFIVPAIGIAGEDFNARGGFTQMGLALPFSPLKWVLKNIGLGALNHWLPDKLSIEELPLYDAAQKRFNVDLFYERFLAPLVGATPGAPGEAELCAALGVISAAADRLPDRLKTYLDIKLPEQFYFDLAVSAQGGMLGSVSIYPPGAAVPQQRQAMPVRFMIPGLAITGPVLNGFELWNLSVGEIIGGAALLVKADLNIDQFDLLPLAIALALPDDVAKYLPPTTRLGKRLILDHLVMLVVPEALIVVPLFFNQLGFEYLGLEGLDLDVNLGFPEPQLDLQEALAVFNQLKAFFTTDALLDEAGLSGVVQNADPATRRKLDLILTLGPAFLGLPDYLGGQTLGSRTNTYSISAYGNLVHLLNATKRLRVADLVQAIPKEDRSSPQPPAPKPSVGFGPLTLDADWLIDSPPGDSNGLLLHLVGGAKLADWADLNAQLDLVAGNLAGFAGSFSVDGGLGKILQLKASGSLAVNTKQGVPVPVPVLPGPVIPPAALAVSVPAAGDSVLSLSGPQGWVTAPGPTWTPQAFTVSWWILPRSLRNYNQVVAGSDAWGSFAFHTTATGAVYAGTDVNTRFTPADLPDGTVQLNVWQQFAFTFDHGTARVYKDGRLLATKTGLTNPAAWRGMHLGWAYADTQIDGVIADVRVWDHALTGDGVRAGVFSQVTGTEAGLAAAWPLDDGTGTTARDLTHHFPGTISGGAWQPSDRLRLVGLSFDADNAGASAQGPQGTPSAFTVEWWLNPRSHKDYNQVITARQGWGGWVFHTTADGAVYTGTDVNTRFTPNEIPAGTVELGVWQHFAFVYDQGSGAFYKNGELIAQKAAGITPPMPWTGFALGLDGQCAELSVWMVARRTDQIQADVYRRVAANEPGLAACWPFDDGAGQTAHELTGHYPATLQGTHWLNPVTPAALALSPVRIAGDCQLLLFEKPAFTGSIRITADNFWFTGRADLLPDNPILRATADVAGYLSAQEFYLAGDASVLIGGARLASAHALITQDRLHADGAWLGGTANLDVQWANGAAFAAGRATFNAGIHVDFNQIIQQLVQNQYVTVANGLHLDLATYGWLDAKVDASGFSAGVNVSFLLNGHTNSLPVFYIGVAPVDAADLGNQIKAYFERMFVDPGPYFTQLFTDAKSWVSGVASGVISWTRTAYQQTGQVLRDYYHQTATQAASLLHSAGYVADETAQVLNNVFTQGANQAAQVLASVQYQANETTRAMIDVFQTNINDTAAALKYAGYGYDVTTGALKDFFTQSQSSIAGALKYAGFNADETAQALIDQFGAGRDVVATAMRLGGWGATATAGALRDQFRLGLNDVASALNSGGFSWNDIASAMKALGEGIGDIAGQIWNFSGHSLDAVRSALQAAAFSFGDIISALANL
jgi:hypothetical protein